MTERNSEGYNLVQSNLISSSTDCNSNSSKSYIHPLTLTRRPTYRSFLYSNLNLNPNPMVILERFPPSGSTSVSKISTGKSLTWLTVIFGISITALLLVYANFPKLSDDEKVHVKLPFNLEEAKQLGLVLNRYKDDNYAQVLTGVFSVYIFLQTFAIPGSLFLSILSGYLFPFPLAITLVCSCSAIGASLCFLVSQVVGKRLIYKWFPDQVTKWAVTVNNQRDNLFNYIVFLRITPFLPNWFINLTAPVVGVPLAPFALGTFIGVAPPSFVAIQTGQTLHSATDAGVSWTAICLLSIFAIVSIIPIFLKQKLKEKFQ